MNAQAAENKLSTPADDRTGGVSWVIKLSVMVMFLIAMTRFPGSIVSNRSMIVEE